MLIEGALAAIFVVGDVVLAIAQATRAQRERDRAEMVAVLGLTVPIDVVKP